MTERLKVERQIAVYLANEARTDRSPLTTPFPEMARDIYESIVQPTEKQARAEVLAACLNKIRERYARLPGFDNASPEFFDLIKEIEALQPTTNAEKLAQRMMEDRKT